MEYIKKIEQEFYERMPDDLTSVNHPSIYETQIKPHFLKALQDCQRQERKEIVEMIEKMKRDDDSNGRYNAYIDIINKIKNLK